MSPHSFVSLARFVAVSSLAVVALPYGRAFNLIGSSWASGSITMRLQLDATAPTNVGLPLNDGSTSWNSVAQAALADWNTVLVRTKFAPVISATSTAAFQNGVNNVLFSTTIYGQSFGTRTLAVTLNDDTDTDGISTVRIKESDLLVNRAIVWNSYRGALRSSPYDLRRAILHEFGHVLGLDHPDEATPPQVVASVMNSTIDQISESPSSDDRAGLSFLYNTAFAQPVLSAQPVSRTVSVGGATTLAAAFSNQLPSAEDKFHSYRWHFKAVGAADFEPLFTVNKLDLDFGIAQLTDAGSYFLEVTTPEGVVTTSTVTLAVNPVALASDPQLINLSTRGIAGAGSNSMIVGFAVTGTGAKTILLRAVGPTLTGLGVTGALADPILTIKDSAGATLFTNDNWEQNANVAAIRSTSPGVGAFPLASGSKDAVLLVTLAPGVYSAIVSSPGGTSGVALVEAYDADSPASPALRLSNLSTRGFVGTGDNVLIAGFNVAGSGPKTYLIRVTGDSLKQFGVSGTLDDPYLKLFRGSTMIREQDDWDSPKTVQPTLAAASTKVGAFALTDRQECAMLVTLAPGGYTAQVSGFEGSSGVALVEVYEVPQ